MPCVHDVQDAGPQLEATDQPGDEVVTAAVDGVRGERVVGHPRLLDEREAPAPRSAQAAQAHARREGGLDAVAHGIGQGHVQHVAGQAVVEGVAADACRRLQPPGQGEGGRLARTRLREQSLLDLGGQAERARALAPLEEIRVATVGDDDERQEVRHLCDLTDDIVARLGRQIELQHADGLATLGHRGQHPPLHRAARRIGVGRQHLHGLRAHGLLQWPAVERQHGRGLLVVAPLAVSGPPRA